MKKKHYFNTDASLTHERGGEYGSTEINNYHFTPYKWFLIFYCSKILKSSCILSYRYKVKKYTDLNDDYLSFDCIWDYSFLSHYDYINNQVNYLSTTILWVSFQFSSSQSVPISGFSVCRLTPATFVPLQTGTKTHVQTINPPFITWRHYRGSFFVLAHKSSPLVSPCSPRIHPLKLLGWIPSFSAIRKRKRAESKLVPLPMTRCLGRPLSFQVT